MVKVNAPSLEYLAEFHLTTLDSQELSLAATELMNTISSVHLDKEHNLISALI